jgi:hypothetical protein
MAKFAPPEQICVMGDVWHLGYEQGRKGEPARVPGPLDGDAWWDWNAGYIAGARMFVGLGGKRS